MTSFRTLRVQVSYCSVWSNLTRPGLNQLQTPDWNLHGDGQGRRVEGEASNGAQVTAQRGYELLSLTCCYRRNRLCYGVFRVERQECEALHKITQFGVHVLPVASCPAALLRATRSQPAHAFAVRCYYNFSDTVSVS